MIRTAGTFASAALACALSLNAAHAVTLNPKGLGQALIFPYYTVNNGRATLLSLVNVSSMGKVAHVYFQEGYNGVDVLDFIVFLSPYDVWTGAVTPVSDSGGAKITSADKSCVLPASDGNGNDFASGIPFSASGFDGTAFPADGGPTSITRTREGSIYVVTDGDLDPQSTIAQLITHVQNGTPDGGTPPGCSQLSGVLLNSTDLLAPTSMLAGSAAIIDVKDGIFFAYDADALSDFTSVPFTNTSSTVGFDDLRHANNLTTSTSSVSAHVFNNEGLPLTLDYANGIDAVSAVFMADTLYNEYFVDANLGASTDWIVTFPTKAYYVNNTTADGRAIPPFVETFGQTTPGQSNIEYSATVFDREEGTAPPDDTILPVTHPTFLSYQTNALTFPPPSQDNLVSGVLGSVLLQPDSPFSSPLAQGTAGWMYLDLSDGDAGTHSMRADTAGVVLTGLPATGFMAYNIVNANAQPGVLANYSAAFPHRSTLRCTTTTGSACP